ncbi:ubiquitin-activating enzyme [Cryptosporidium ubiquitum]|uniref:Ubiquitin-activating enzyme n=1 Tax=Cryptosporidium ubiquitum TaxID=857276 RepID=A0A1J4MCV0_9CRYT|nr:ubiquitin-activating enzyme [Cryptosporidium ubiquitum]OII72057.1 ubiquitin-activating enzyme [Cryptosporidium ubiquitum]
MSTNRRDEIDTNLYSRQIGTLGLEAMGKLIKLRVLIVGLRGLGVEIAKNIILAGPKSVTLVDDEICSFSDMGANFYITEDDVKKGTRRSDACLNKLASLNEYVQVIVFHGQITNQLIFNHDLIVCADVPLSQQIKYNEVCRGHTPNIGFISANCLGLCGSIFVDFGDSFNVFDGNGEEPKSAIISKISRGKETTSITCLAEKLLPFQEGDYVMFREVQGMTELNGTGPHKIISAGKHQFTVKLDSSMFKEYEREGIVTQVKVPMNYSFRSLKDALEYPICDEQGILIVPDLNKFGRSEQLFFSINSVLKYSDIKGSRPEHTDLQAINECHTIAENMNENSKRKLDSNDEKKEFVVSVDSIDKDVLEKVCKYSRCCLSPMAAFLGGIAAQEIVKFVGKYTPLRQFFFFDAFEQLDLVSNEVHTKEEFMPIGSRYDDQIIIFGRNFQNKLSEKNVFIVGAGALGCEFLKSMALLGVGCGPNGTVTITDMDNIEVSNLNRQFLFRQEHVGSPKSAIAAQVIRTINKDINIVSLQTRVGTETEDIFDDLFWNKTDFVINALDNVPSRMYINDRCLWYEKPLLESGTLGTKANSETYLPHKTQSYSDNRDPAEESIPLCTLKHFPHAIEHTIEWARDAFQGVFTSDPQEVVTFLNNPSEYIQNLRQRGNPHVILEKSQKIFELINWISEKTPTHEDCIQRAIYLFHDYFYCQIKQLLANFPPDHVNSDGFPFWSGPKRCPKPIKLNIEDKLHFDFIFSASNLYSSMVRLPEISDSSLVFRIANETILPEFNAKTALIKIDEDESASNNENGSSNPVLLDTSIAEEYTHKLLSVTENQIKRCLDFVQPIEFEKDDDSNFHVDFINSCANLRARNYSIKECDRHKCKMIAGRIIPAMATTTAMVTGLVSFEALKVSSASDYKIELFKNSFINLSLPLFVITEPLPAPKTTSKDFDPIVEGPLKVRPEGFTAWDKLVIEQRNGTIQDVIDFLTNQMNLETQIISFGNICLYNAYMPNHQERKCIPVVSLIEQITKKKLHITKNSIALEVSCCDIDDGVDTIIPSIKFIFK